MPDKSDFQLPTQMQTRLHIVKIDTRGRITLPIMLRRQLGVYPDGHLNLIIENDHIVIDVTYPDDYKRIHGSEKGQFVLPVQMRKHLGLDNDLLPTKLAFICEPDQRFHLMTQKALTTQIRNEISARATSNLSEDLYEESCRNKVGECL